METYSNDQKIKDERLYGMLCHLSAFAMFFFPFGNILGPMLVWQWKRREFAFVDDQGKESLNFQISVTIYLAIAGFLVMLLVGIPLLVIIGIADIVLIVLAGVSAGNGVPYRYPFVIRFVQ